MIHVPGEPFTAAPSVGVSQYFKVVRGSVVAALVMAALRTAAAKRAGLPSRLCNDTMRIDSRASLPVDQSCGDGDPRLSIRRFPPETPAGRDLRRAFRLSHHRVVKSEVASWRNMTADIPASHDWAANTRCHFP